MPMQHPNVIAWDRLETGDRARDPDSGDYRWRLLAEGDSWFTLGGLPTSNLLFTLEFPANAIVVNCALPGDTIRHMAEIAANRELQAAFSARFGYRWDAILLSGGGNDLIDRVRDILLPPPRRAAPVADPADYCDEAAIASLLADVTAGYRSIVALRDAPGSPCAGAPIVTHTYDWVTPRSAPARFVLVPAKGPWLQPALTAAKVPKKDWLAVSDYLVGRLGDAIAALDAAAPAGLPAFHVVDTRGTLSRATLGATGVSNDWMNEIHPTADGYGKLAALIGGAAGALLPP
ncbi:MAG: SGNH/GDSL hydrolase family protein [Betaproteobacteria bacterium]